MAKETTKTTKTEKTSKATQPKKPTPKKPTAKKGSGKGGIIAAVVAIAVVVVAIIVAIMLILSNKKENLTLKNGKGEEIAAVEYRPAGTDYTIRVPADFKEMSQEDIEAKYINGSAPAAVFTNDDSTVNVAINTSDDTLTNDQIQEYLNVMMTVLESSSNVVESNMTEVSGHNLGNIKLVAESDDEGEIFNNIAFFSDNDKLVVFAFNCTENERDEWEQVGDEIVNSLKFDN